MIFRLTFITLFVWPLLSVAGDVRTFSDLKGVTLSPIEFIIPIGSKGISCSVQNMIGKKESPLYSGRFIRLQESSLGYRPHFGSMSIFDTRKHNQYNPGCDQFDNKYNAITMTDLDLSNRRINFELIGANFKKQVDTGDNVFSTLRILACPLADNITIQNRLQLRTTCEYYPLTQRNGSIARANEFLSWAWSSIFGGAEKSDKKAKGLPTIDEMLRHGFSNEEIATTYMLGDNSDTVPRVGWIECKDSSIGAVLRYAVLKEHPKGGFAACR